METGTYDFTIKVGATWDETIFLVDDTDAHNPIDISNYDSASLAIKSSKDSSVYLLEISSPITDGSGLVLGGTDGSIRIRFGADKTRSLSGYSMAVYDLKLTISSDPSTVDYPLMGAISFEGSITL